MGMEWIRRTTSEIYGTSICLRKATNQSLSGSSFHLNADPDPAFYFNADLDPDPAHHRGDANLRPLAYKPSFERPRPSAAQF